MFITEASYLCIIFVLVMEKKKICLEIYGCDVSNHIPLLYADAGIRAGFPNPAQDFMDLSIDLNTELIRHPSATFYGRVKGDSLIDAGVHDGDILVIDKSLRPSNKDMAVCFVDGDFTLKFIKIDEKEKGVIWLLPANTDFEPIKVTPENEFIIWGIVTYTIKKQR